MFWECIPWMFRLNICGGYIICRSVQIMTKQSTVEGGKVFADVSKARGVWATRRELEVCGGSSTKTIDAVVYEIVGGDGRRVMESMSCRVLVSAKDMNQSRGRCYGRIVTKSRRVLRFFVQVAGKSLQEVRRQKVTEKFVCCQERGYLVSW